MTARATAAAGPRRGRPGAGRSLGLPVMRLAAAAIALGLLAWAVAARRVTAGEASAAEVVEKNAAARGGLDAWRKVQTMVWIGHIESAHAPVPSMVFELQQKRPNKTRLQIDAFGDRSLRVFDGVRGWKVRSIRGRPEVQPYTPQELAYAQAGPGLDGPLLDSAAKGASVTLVGVDEIGGRKAHHLKVHPARGGDEDVWVDTETYLELRSDRLAAGPGGPAGPQRRVSVTYGDYRTVDGLKVPFLITTGGGPGAAGDGTHPAATPDRMQIERVVVNTPLDDAVFANPAARHTQPGQRRTSMPRARAPGARWPPPAALSASPAAPTGAPSGATEEQGAGP